MPGKITNSAPMKAGVTVCSAMSAKTCPAVFVHFLAISHLRRRLRTYQNLRGNTERQFTFPQLAMKVDELHVFWQFDFMLLAIRFFLAIQFFDFMLPLSL